MSLEVRSLISKLELTGYSIVVHTLTKHHPMGESSLEK